jgi:hypothetical protein
VWHKVILDILALASVDKDKTVHYYDVIKIAAKAGLKHQHLSNAHKVAGEQGPVPVPAKRFSQIVRLQLTRKERSGIAPHAVPQVWKDVIEEHWKSISRVAPHDQFVVKRKTAKSPTVFSELYYQQYPIKEAWNMFKELHPGFPFRLTTYRKYKPRSVKKPQSVQDACPTCKEAKLYHTTLTAAHPMHLTHDDIEAKGAFEFHKMVRDTRYADFGRQMDALRPTESILILDFKANITLGKGPIEDSHVFFRAPQRTVFGAAAFFCSTGGIRYKVHFTVISSVLRHDSKTLLEILRQNILAHPIWAHFRVKKTNVWMDNAGQHFRNFETFATFHDLGLERNQEFELNFFAEYHGKSECDRHFGLISRLYKEATRYGECRDIQTTSDFIRMYTDGIREAGGHVLPSRGGFWEEMLPESARKTNVIVCEFQYATQTNFMKKLLEEGTAKDKKKPQMPLPYTRRRLEVESIQKGGETLVFSMNLYYQFSFACSNSGVWAISAKLHDRVQKTDFPFSVSQTLTPNYTVTLGVASSWRPKYSSVATVVRRRRFHEEQDYGVPVQFLQSPEIFDDELRI